MLGVLAIAVTVRLALYSGDSGPKVVAATDSIPLAEKRLQSLREKAATLPAREALLKQVSAELALREKGIIQAETAPQAQAHLLDTIHRIAAQNGFDARGADQFTEAKPLGDAYGVVSVDGNLHLRDRTARQLSRHAGQPAGNHLHQRHPDHRARATRTRPCRCG